MFIDQKMCLLPLRKQSCVKAKRIIVSTKAKKTKTNAKAFQHSLTVFEWSIFWIRIRTFFQNTFNVTCIGHCSSTWCAFKNKPYVTVCLSDNWTFILMRALLDSPASSLSWSILVKVQRTNTGSLWVRFSVGPCPHVSLHQSKRGGGLYLLWFWNRHGGSIQWWYQSHTETCSCGG